MAFLMPFIQGAASWIGSAGSMIGTGVKTALTTTGGQMALMTGAQGIMSKNNAEASMKAQALNKPTYMPDEEKLRQDAMRAISARKGSRSKNVLTSQDGSLGG
jgi:hypothetical protein